MIDLNKVLTFTEAAEKWGLADFLAKHTRGPSTGTTDKNKHLAPPLYSSLFRHQLVTTGVAYCRLK